MENGFLSIPSDIQSYLTPEEKMIKIGKSKEWAVYVTDKRVLFKKEGVFGKEIVEASYRHISSIEYKKRSPWEYIISGILFIVLPFVLPHIAPALYEDFPTLELPIYVVLILIGIIFIIMSFFIRPSFKIHIVGRNPLTMSGELEEIIRIIRQYRERVETEITKR